MSKILGGFGENEVSERQEIRGTQKPQKTHKKNGYRKKYKEEKKHCEKLSNKNKSLKMEMKYQQKLHAEQKVRYKAEGKAEAYENTLKLLAGGKRPAELSEPVIEAEGVVSDV